MRIYLYQHVGKDMRKQCILLYRLVGNCSVNIAIKLKDIRIFFEIKQNNMYLSYQKSV